jgi:riboflavin kinase / FMN adenylyltransferase
MARLSTVERVPAMKVLKTVSEFGQIRKGGVLTIGNFDGVHAGHQEIFRTAGDLARRRGVQMNVMTFEPHPVAVLHPEKAPGVLTPLSVKLALLRQFVSDFLVVGDCRESVEWASAHRSDQHGLKPILQLSAGEFVDRLIMPHIAPAVFVEGDDFHFGSGRGGDVTALTRLGAERGFEVVVVPPKQVKLSTGETIRVSSTMIRYMLESGHVAEAAVALGRPYRMVGPVVSGWGRGRKLGFPTLNMGKPSQILPADGVYAGYVEIAADEQAVLEENRRMPAVFSIGQARTFGDQYPLLIEAHVLLGNIGDMTGKWMIMDFIQKLRDQHKFGSVEELVRQIDKDCRTARNVLTAVGDKK